MAKQRRPQTRSSRAPSGSSRLPQPPGGAPTPPEVVAVPLAPKPAERRSTYVDAVALYEQGLERLQRHDYSGAAESLESVLRLYPEEKELHERVRLYLNICRKQASNNQAVPQTIEERL